MAELEEEIRKIINNITEREYIGKLQIAKDDDIWTLYLYLNRELIPLVISVQGDEQHFKDVITSEIKKRRLSDVKYWKTDRTLPSLICNDNGEFELGW